MPGGIDHIVIAVADPDAAAAEVTEKVGLAFTAGGRHPGLGTFNRIAFLGDAYLELIGVEDAGLAAGWPMGSAALRALERGGGFATYALVDDAIRTTVARLQANGSRIGPVVHGSRERPDGERVEWWSAAPPELGPDRPPFLIKHLQAGAEWGADAVAARRSFIHPIGSSVRLLGLEIKAPDPLRLAAECLELLGVEFRAVGDVAVGPSGAHVLRLAPGGVGDPVATVTIRAQVPSARTLSMLGIGVNITP
jgi:catechol 2,3-dioxygenase-like lactoylglutathione lyase family enzyme